MDDTYLGYISLPELHGLLKDSSSNNASRAVRVPSPSAESQVPPGQQALAPEAEGCNKRFQPQGMQAHRETHGPSCSSELDMNVH